MTDLTRAEQRVRRLADDWEFPEGKHLTTVLAEYDRMRRDIAGVTAVIGQRDAYRAALTEILEQAGHVLGLEDQT